MLFDPRVKRVTGKETSLSLSLYWGREKAERGVTSSAMHIWDKFYPSDCPSNTGTRLGQQGSGSQYTALRSREGRLEDRTLLGYNQVPSFPILRPS